MSLALFLTSIGIFFVTDTDDLIVLLLLWLAAKGRAQRRAIIIGQYLGITTLILAAWIISRGMLHFNITHWTHWLGLVPFILGLTGLINWWSTRHRHTPPRLTQIVSLPVVWSLTIGNGGDNLSIYIPFFTRLTLTEFGAVLLVFLAMIGLWLWISQRLARSASATAFFARFGAWLSPLLFILVGLIILF
ncbi:cadmium resistance transporter [Levilactobacillus tujiorum]|uniref:cadmium resistance transporter n=1 Tax=Levilactobacillus tujiorum TaxID=2912243 RepID=UPI0014575EF4|nr:cadmium resistance transporter [Levilactobacillus tujiorum]NLR31002.1 permease, cadmium resistance protein [Levilactobacillus tujiorum]